MNLVSEGVKPIEPAEAEADEAQQEEFPEISRPDGMVSRIRRGSGQS